MKGVLCTWLLLVANLQAAEPTQLIDFDIPSASLELSLQRFAAQSGVSVGMPGNLPDVPTRAVRGRYEALQALRQMLAGSGLEAIPTGESVFRLQPVAAVRNAQPQPLSELAAVVVTATKRPQALFDLPASLTVVDDAALSFSAPLAGSRAALDFDAATSSTNLGPGRDRHFIRGVADSPFPGPSQATVSIQFDETRLNYSAPDPDLRLLDMERVEVLKGPQGPLYGTGALGGVMHLVPRRPDLADSAMGVAVSLADTARGGASPGASMMLNLPLRPGALGLRAVAYAAREAGWIDNADGRANANATRLGGARLALRGRAADWLLDLQGAAQLAHTRDSQYVLGDAPTLLRSGVLPEPRDNDLYLGSAVLRGPLAGGELLLASSYVTHEVDGIQDASASAAAFDATAPLRYHDDRNYRLLGNELRYSGGTDTGVAWLAGVSHLLARSHVTGHLDAAAGNTADSDLSRRTSDLALFGEGTVPLGTGWRLTAGLRVTRVTDENEQPGSGTMEQEASVAHTATPSLSLAWHAADRRSLVYLRFARAVRPGGLNPDTSAANQRFRADELSNLDLGIRLMPAGDVLTLQSALYATRWHHVQSDYLLESGLVGTRNVGRAANLGVEGQLHANLGSGWGIGMGAVVQHARLEVPALPAAVDDARMPMTPDFRAYLSLGRDLHLGSWNAGLHARLDYNGASRLSFDPELDRRMPHSTMLAAGARLTRAGYELQLSISNLLDSRSDTFAFGNPFSIRQGPQHTPLQPRTASLQLSYGW